MDNTAARHTLKDVRLWAKARLAAGFDTPEASYQYMKLIEAVDAILSDLDAANREQAAPKTDRHLRVVEIRTGKEIDEPPPCRPGDSFAGIGPRSLRVRSTPVEP